MPLGDDLFCPLRSTCPRACRPVQRGPPARFPGARTTENSPLESFPGVRCPFQGRLWGLGSLMICDTLPGWWLLLSPGGMAVQTIEMSGITGSASRWTDVRSRFDSGSWGRRRIYYAAAWPTGSGCGRERGDAAKFRFGSHAAEKAVFRPPFTDRQGMPGGRRNAASVLILYGERWYYRCMLIEAALGSPQAEKGYLTGNGEDLKREGPQIPASGLVIPRGIW